MLEEELSKIASTNRNSKPTLNGRTRLTLGGQKGTESPQEARVVPKLSNTQTNSYYSNIKGAERVVYEPGKYNIPAKGSNPALVEAERAFAAQRLMNRERKLNPYWELGDELSQFGNSNLGEINQASEDDYEGGNSVLVDASINITGQEELDLTDKQDAGGDAILAADAQYREKINLLKREGQNTLLAGNIQQTSWDNQLHIFGTQSQSTLVALQEIIQDNSPNFLPDNIQDTIKRFEASIRGNATDFVDALNIMPIADIRSVVSGDFPVARTTNIDGSSTFALDDDDQVLDKTGKRMARDDTFAYMSTARSTNKALRLLESFSEGEDAGPGRRLPLNVGDSPVHSFYAKSFVGPAPRSGADIYAKEQFFGASFVGPALPIDGDIEANRQLSPRERADEDFATVKSNLTILAGSYIHADAVGGFLQEGQMKGLEANILHRFMTSPANIDAKALMPLPNETGVLGLKRTSGSYNETVGGQGTPFTRMQFGLEAAKRGWTPEGTPDEWYGYLGNIRQSLFKPSFITGDISGNDRKRRKSKQQEKQFFDVAKETARILRRHFPSNRNESAGEGLSPGFDHNYGDQLSFFHHLDQSARDEFGAEFGDYAQALSRKRTDKYRLTGEAYQAANLISKANFPAEVRDAGHVDWDVHGAYGTLHGGSAEVSANVFMEEPSRIDLLLNPTGKAVEQKMYEDEIDGHKSMTPLGIKLEGRFEEEERRLRLELLAPKEGDDNFVGPTLYEGIRQHSPAWHRAREGLITASQLTNSSGQLLDAKGMAANIALKEYAKTDPVLAKKLEFIGNADTVEGTLGEEEALKEFLLMKAAKGDPLIHTEVGLLQNKDLPGFGASPDGRLHDKEGNSRGLLELKWLTEGSAKSSLRKYMPQMQMQMAVTGEKTTDFFVYEKHTGISHHELVHADPDMQAKLIREGRRAMALAPELTKKRAEELNTQTPAQRRGMTALEESNQDGGSPTATYDVEVDVIKATTFTAAEINAVRERVNRRDKNASIEGGYESVAAMKEFNSQMELGASQAREATAVNKEKEKADREAAAATRQLRDAAAGAAKGLLKLGLGADESAMTTIRASAEAGMTAEQGRGIEFALTENGMDIRGARAVMVAAGAVQREFNDATQVAGAYTTMQKAWAGAGLNKIAGTLPSIQQIAGMGSNYLSFAQERIDMGRNPQQKAQIANALRVLEMAASTASAEELTMDGVLNEQGARVVNTAKKETTNWLQTEFEQGLAATGEYGGKALGYGEVAEGNSQLLLNAAKLAVPLAVTGLGAATGYGLGVMSNWFRSQGEGGQSTSTLMGNFTPKTPKQVLEERSRQLTDMDFNMNIKPLPETSIDSAPLVNVNNKNINNVEVQVYNNDGESQEVKTVVNEDTFNTTNWRSDRGSY